MERKLGEIFTCNGKTYQVVPGFWNMQWVCS